MDEDSHQDAAPAAAAAGPFASSWRRMHLTAAGVAEADATAAVFIQRLFTSYLPPIWGWITLVWMRRREYL